VLLILGPPCKEDILAIDSQYCRDVLNSIHISKKKNLRAYFSKADDSCLDLINKLLQFNPAKRLTVEEAL